MAAQLVRPAGAGHETLWVILCCAVIAVVAGSIISLRQEVETHTALSADQIDARHDLTPAEQGIHADLMVAVEEIDALTANKTPAPTPQALSAMSLPPFAADATSNTRGSHAWHIIRAEAQTAYAGISANTKVAGSLLLRLPDQHGDESVAADAHGHAEEAGATIWLNRAPAARQPASLTDAALARDGWRKIITQFNAGVTRQKQP